MYHSTPYFTVSQVGCSLVEIIDDRGRTIYLRPQDAIELANEIIKQAVVVPKPEKPRREITLEEAKKTDHRP